MKDYTIESIKKIRDAIARNKLVLFVGSGVSVNSGLPLWKDVIKEFAKGVGISTVTSIDDYLKIPQYYFNSRGSKEYYDTVTNIFDLQVKPNPLHDILFELNPAHIITTNFDNLLEQATLNKGVFFDTVCKDKDLPYTPNCKMIIKMHGDLREKNIVLKEDDYLSYSNEFKLIENYVKALFSNYTILFIGYSVNDPDVRVIFQWVKDILKGDFQRAYLLNTDNSNQSSTFTEHQYFQNRGINILYYSEIENHCATLPDAIAKLLAPSGQKLYKFIKLIKTGTLGTERKSLNAVEALYTKLSVLDVLNKVLPINIKHLLENNIDFHYEMSQLSTSSPIIQRYISEVNNESAQFDGNKKKAIDRIFLKADISELSIRQSPSNPSQSYTITSETPPDKSDAELLLLFQYKQIKENVLLPIIDGDSKSATLFRKAFFYYKLQDYHSAYLILKKVSIKAFKERDYLTFFLSESNRLNVGQRFLYSWSRKNVPAEELEQITDEVENIDVDEIYMQMPQIERKKYFFLKDLLNFKLIYQTFYNFIKFQNEIREEENIQRFTNIEMGPIFKLNFSVKQLWEYINLNYIMIEHYSELKELYRNYVESVLISYTTKDRDANATNSDFLFGEQVPAVNKISSIPYLALYMMVSDMPPRTQTGF